jgi:hypothetical protein
MSVEEMAARLYLRAIETEETTDGEEWPEICDRLARWAIESAEAFRRVWTEETARPEVCKT